jgi:hypothetical protein
MASEQLNLDIPKSSVDDAAKVAEEIRSNAYLSSATIVQAKSPDVLTSAAVATSDEFSRFAREAEKSVARWIAQREPISSLEHLPTGPFDFLQTSQDGARIGIEVRGWRHPWGGGAVQRIRESFLRAFYEVSRGRLTDFKFFLVAATADLALELATRLERRTFEPAFGLSIGYLLPDGEYEELTSAPSDAATLGTRQARARLLRRE